jgi:hypothetical protein
VVTEDSRAFGSAESCAAYSAGVPAGPKRGAYP